VLLQVVAGVIDLRQRAAQQLGQPLVARLHVLLRLQRLRGAVEQGAGTGFVFAQAVQRRLRRLQQRLRVRQPPVLQVELFPFAGQRGQALELGELPLQAFALLLQLALLCARLLEAALRGAPVAPELAQGACVDAGVVVEQLAHGLGPRQALPGVLAVDVEQQLTQLAQLGRAGGAAVDPSAAAALGVELALEPQGLARFALEALLGQPLAGRRRGLEFGHHLGACRALAHHRGVGARAQRQLQGVDEDRLAGPGLAGEHGKASLQIQFQFAHDHKIAQRHALPAQPTPPSFQCSLRRRVSK